MKLANYLLYTTIALILYSCGNTQNTKSANFALSFEGNKTKINSHDTLIVSVRSLKNKTIDSVIFSINGKKTPSSNKALSTSLYFLDQKLGNRKVEALVYTNGNSEKVSKKIKVLAHKKPKLYTYKIINQYPHDINAYTQGLEFYNDTLYESTGQYNESSLRKTDYKTGKVFQNIPLEDRYFGEGLTILNQKLYQLTWREGVGFIYNVKDLKKTGSFVFNKSKEGWGLCNDGQRIFKSDGTEKIWTLNSETLAEEDYIEIYTNTSKIKSVNELEWVNGKIYANIYEREAIAIVNPDTGAVEGVINLKGLKKKVKQHADLNVLNGIAFKGDKDRIYVTGKNWDKLFEIEIIEKN